MKEHSTLHTLHATHSSHYTLHTLHLTVHIFPSTVDTFHSTLDFTTHSETDEALRPDLLQTPSLSSILHFKFNSRHLFSICVLGRPSKAKDWQEKDKAEQTCEKLYVPIECWDILFIYIYTHTLYII